MKSAEKVGQNENSVVPNPTGGLLGSGGRIELDKANAAIQGTSGHATVTLSGAGEGLQSGNRGDASNGAWGSDLEGIEGLAQNKNSLFVFHIPREWGDPQLASTFAPYGALHIARISKWPDGTSRGFGFVSYEDESKAFLAIAAVDGKSVGDGKRLSVSFKRDKSDVQSTLMDTAAKRRPNDFGPYSGVSNGFPRAAGQTNSQSSVSNESADRTIFIFHVPPTWTDTELNSHFVKFGTITSSHVARKPDGSSKGYAFVTFTSQAEAVTAIATMNGFQVENGKRLKLSLKSEEHNQPIGSFGMSNRQSSFGCTIFVASFPPTWDGDELRSHFLGCGTILSSAVRTTDSPQATGHGTDPTAMAPSYGFVTFATRDAAINAVQRMNGVVIAGKKLKVSIKRGEEALAPEPYVPAVPSSVYPFQSMQFPSSLPVLPSSSLPFFQQAPQALSLPSQSWQHQQFQSLLPSLANNLVASALPFLPAYTAQTQDAVTAMLQQQANSNRTSLPSMSNPALLAAAALQYSKTHLASNAFQIPTPAASQPPTAAATNIPNSLLPLLSHPQWSFPYNMAASQALGQATAYPANATQPYSQQSLTEATTSMTHPATHDNRHDSVQQSLLGTQLSKPVNLASQPIIPSSSYPTSTATGSQPSRLPQQQPPTGVSQFSPSVGNPMFAATPMDSLTAALNKPLAGTAFASDIENVSNPQKTANGFNPSTWGYAYGDPQSHMPNTMWTGMNDMWRGMVDPGVWDLGQGAGGAKLTGGVGNVGLSVNSKGSAFDYAPNSGNTGSVINPWQRQQSIATGLTSSTPMLTQNTSLAQNSMQRPFGNAKIGTGWG